LAASPGRRSTTSSAEKVLPTPTVDYQVEIHAPAQHLVDGQGVGEALVRELAP